MSEEIGITFQDFNDGVAVELDLTCTYTTEDDYGADADGNRGIRVTFLDDVVVNFAVDERGNDVEYDKEDIDLLWDDIGTVMCDKLWEEELI